MILPFLSDGSPNPAYLNGLLVELDLLGLLDARPLSDPMRLQLAMWLNSIA